MASIADFINQDFPAVFLMGFSAGVVVAGISVAIRAVVKIAVRVIRGRG